MTDPQIIELLETLKNIEHILFYGFIGIVIVLATGTGLRR